MLVDGLGVRCDQLREAARREHARVAAELLAHAPDDAVDLAGEAVDDAALQRVHGVAPDHGRRGDELDAREARGAVEERLHRDRDARGQHAAHVLARRRDGVEVRRRAEVDGDAGPARARQRGHRVDDAVGPDLARVVHQDRDAAAHPRADQERVDRERLLAHPGPLRRQHGHGRGHDQRGHLGGVEVAQREQPVELHREVVGRAQRARGDAPRVGELLALPESQMRLRVADVDREQHLAEPAARSAGCSRAAAAPRS